MTTNTNSNIATWMSRLPSKRKLAEAGAFAVIILVMFAVTVMFAKSFMADSHREVDAATAIQTAGDIFNFVGSPSRFDKMTPGAESWMELSALDNVVRPFHTDAYDFDGKAHVTINSFGDQQVELTMQTNKLLCVQILQRYKSSPEMQSNVWIQGAGCDYVVPDVEQGPRSATITFTAPPPRAGVVARDENGCIYLVKGGPRGATVGAIKDPVSKKQSCFNTPGEAQ